MELLAVLVIISISCAIVLPAADAVLYRAKVDTAIRELITDIRFAQQMAMGEGRAYHIVFNKALQNYRLGCRGHPLPITVKLVTFPEGLTLIGTNFTDDRLSFNIMGVPSAGGTVELLDKRGRIIEITVLLATGRVRVYR